ncbi:MAG: hypothetical protein V4534_02555 [Myxococcota bacterium]
MNTDETVGSKSQDVFGRYAAGALVAKKIGVFSAVVAGASWVADFEPSFLKAPFAEHVERMKQSLKPSQSFLRAPKQHVSFSIAESGLDGLVAAAHEGRLDPLLTYHHLVNVTQALAEYGAQLQTGQTAESNHLEPTTEENLRSVADRISEMALPDSSMKRHLFSKGLREKLGSTLAYRKGVERLFLGSDALKPENEQQAQFRNLQFSKLLNQVVLPTRDMKDGAKSVDSLMKVLTADAAVQLGISAIPSSLTEPALKLLYRQVVENRVGPWVHERPS